MGITKNSLVELDLSKVAYLVDGTPGQFRYGTLSDTNIAGVKTYHQPLYVGLVTVPLDVIIFGRTPFWTPNVGNGTGSFDLGCWRQMWTKFLDTRWTVGVHKDYWALSSEMSQTSWPAPILGETGAEKIRRNGKANGEWTGAINVDGKRWGYVDDWHIRRPMGSVYLDKHCTAVSLTSGIEELSRELIYDADNDLLHYITLVKYTFKFLGKKDNPLQNFTEEHNPVNILLDFKYNEKSMALVGIDILNDNLGNVGIQTGLNFDSSLSKYQVSMDCGSQPVTPWESHAADYKSYIELNETPFSLWTDHKLYHPEMIAANTIDSFTTFHGPSGVALLYRHENGLTKYFFYNQFVGLAPWVDWRPSTVDRSYWVCETRGPERTLLDGREIEKVWGFNPSGTIDTQHGWNFPIIRGDIQRWNSMDTSTAILASLDGITSKYWVSYAPGAAMNVYTTLPGITATSRFADTSLTQQKRELALAGIAYTDSNSNAYNVLYILTSQYLFMNVVYGTGSSKLYKYNRIMAEKSITGVTAGPPTSNFYLYEYKIGGVIAHVSRVDVTGCLPTVVTLNVQPDPGRSTQYNIQLRYPNVTVASSAYRKILEGYWEVTTAATSGVVGIDIANCKIAGNDVYVRMNLVQYLRDNPDLNATNLTFFVRGMDEHLPYVVRCTGLVDARPLQLGDLLFNCYGTWDVPPLSAGFYASGVIHVTTDQMNSGHFSITSTGVLDNILKTEIAWTNEDMNWEPIPLYPPVTRNVVTMGSGFIGATLACSAFTRGTGRLFPRLIHNPSNRRRSQTDSTVNGVGSGIKFTVWNKVFEYKTFWLPMFSIYDKHKFIIGKIYLDNIIDIDKQNNTSYNYPARGGRFFTPKLGDENKYRLSFNFRCAPNYLQGDHKYTVYYENLASAPVAQRISTPMIKRWWIVGIPYKLDCVEPYIYPLGIFYRGEDSIPVVARGRLEDILTEKDYPTDLSMVNFLQPRAFYKDAIEAQGGYSPMDYNLLISQAYLHEDSISKIMCHLSGVISGTQSIYNIGTVWCSGHYPTASGYVDLHNVMMTNTYGGVLSSGFIPNGSYGFFFIAEDTLAHFTGVDLSYLNMHGRNGWLPPSSSFTY